MFSQFLPATPRSSNAAPGERRSPDQLAESAMTSLRKSLRTRQAQPQLPQVERRGTPNLEDRLRAAFTVGDASSAGTSRTSLTPSPAPQELEQQDLQPAQPPQAFIDPLSVALPSSPRESLDVYASPISPLQSAPKITDPLLVPLPPDEDDIDTLRDRLKLLEQRFSDVSSSFKRLQAEKDAAEKVLRDLTPVSELGDGSLLRTHLSSVAQTAQARQDEVKYLTARLKQQASRIEEMRDTHRLESASHTDQIDRLRKQLEESEALLKSSRTSSDQLASVKAEVETLQSNAAHAEEEKKKMVRMLKTVRTKLTVVEKERDDGKARESGLDAEKISLKTDFERQLASTRERYENEAVARRGQAELDALSHSKAAASRDERIATLETSVQGASRYKAALFDQLQIRQAELESSQTQISVLEGQLAELQFQLRQSSSLPREPSPVPESVSSPMSPEATELGRLLSATEAKYEARLAEMRIQLQKAERDRTDAESEWSRLLHERSRETEQLRRTLNTNVQERDEEARVVDSLREELASMKQLREQETATASLNAEQVAQAEERESKHANDISERDTRIEALTKQIEDGRANDSQLRASNKTLREELRKLQSSAALLEKQRNPGVGYWSNASRRSIDGPSHNANESRAGTPNGSAVSKSPDGSEKASREEEVNLEYLRNVILQFLEHPEMRSNLVRVLSVILHFTPQETRRLIAKVG